RLLISAVASVMKPPSPRDRRGALLSQGEAGTLGLASLAEARRLQIAIRLNHLAQPVLGRPVTTIGVGMVALHELLVSRLDFGRGGADVKGQRIEALGGGSRDRAGVFLLAARARPAAPAGAEQVERIGGGLCSPVGAALAAGMG